MCTATAPDVNCVYIPKCVWKEVKVKSLNLLSASITSTISGKALNNTARAIYGIFLLLKSFSYELFLLLLMLYVRA